MTPPPLLRLVGRPRIERAAPGAAAFVLPDERRARALLVLALHGERWVLRGELARLLWPGLARERGLANLRKTLHLAREWPFAGTLEAGPDALRWPVATDVQAARRAEREGRLGEALADTAGTLADGFDDAGNAAWSQWLDGERTQWAHERRRWAQARLAQLAAEPEQAAGLARRMLDADPLDEDAMVALLAALRALQRLDEQREALTVYALRLQDELGVEPSARVRAQVQPGHPGAAAAAAPAVPVVRDADGLVGRAGEAAAVLGLIGREGEEEGGSGPAGARLVTITGPAGVGKSSLLKAALRRHASPLVWVPLDDLGDAAQAQARLAAELQVSTRSNDLLAAICAQLARAPRLVALDNCEHLPGIEPLVQRLLAAHPAMRVVATSRRRLNVPHEQVLALHGLPVPGPAATAHEAQQSDAWRLFAAAAVEARPDFDAPARATIVARIVRRLGGLPLAILLAAHWVRHLEAEVIEADLERSLDLLEREEEGEERPEHRSLRAAFEGSWRSLATREQACWAALAVFPGDFPRAAALEVGTASMPVLAQLADRSLLQFASDGRANLHPLLRQFAGEKLGCAAREAAARRHATFFLRWAERQLAPVDRGEDAASREVGAELENLRSAWRWAIEHGDAAGAGACATLFKNRYGVHGSPADGLALLLEAHASVEHWPPAAAAQWHLAVAALYTRMTRLDECAAHARQALARARAAARRDLVGRALQALAGTFLWRGHLGQARRLFVQAEKHAHASHDAVGVTLAIGVQAMIEGDLGDHERAAATMATAARMSLALGQSAHAATQLTNLSYLHLSHGRWVEAQAVARDALALCERARLVQPVPPLTFNLAIAATGLGEFTEADRLCLEALQRAQALANGDIESGAAAQRVRVAIEQQAWAAARSRLREALPIARAGPYRQAQCDLVLSHLRIAAAAAKSGAGPGPDPRWLRWYLAQEDRQAAEREIAQALLERLGTKARRGPVPDLALSDLLQAIAQTLGG